MLLLGPILAITWMELYHDRTTITLIMELYHEATIELHYDLLKSQSKTLYKGDQDLPR